MEDLGDCGEDDDETNEEEREMLLDHCMRHLSRKFFKLLCLRKVT
ncbi:unnamed protein product [Brugia timori]|uniref:Protein UL30 n=1 Tax=Brugia timori TaxID=42155 RepID=A0A0R3QW25_9BILA|nr:unnamed protein product [Brugia timori]